MKDFIAYLSDKKTFKVEASLKIRADGYLTALSEANRLCNLNHPTLYVASMKEE